MSNTILERARSPRFRCRVSPAVRLDFDGVGGKSAASWKASRRLLDLNQVRWKALEHADLIGASSEIRDSQKVSCRCAQFHQAPDFAFRRFDSTMPE